MPNVLFETGRQACLDGGIVFSTDVMKPVLIDLDAAFGSSGLGGGVINSVTNATNPSIGTTAAHNLAAGDIVQISGVTGSTGVNGTWTVATIPDSTHFTVTTSAPGAYVSGGYAVRTSGTLNLSDIPSGARISTGPALSSKTTIVGVIGGVADAADFSFTAVSGARSEAIVIYKDTGTASTSRLWFFIDNATNLPVLPNGADIGVAWDNGTNRIVRV